MSRCRDHCVIVIVVSALLGSVAARLLITTHALQDARADLRRCQAASPLVPIDSRAVLVGTGSAGDPLRLAMPHRLDLRSETP